MKHPLARLAAIGFATLLASGTSSAQLIVRVPNPSVTSYFSAAIPSIVIMNRDGSRRAVEVELHTPDVFVAIDDYFDINLTTDAIWLRKGDTGIVVTSIMRAGFDLSYSELATAQACEAGPREFSTKLIGASHCLLWIDEYDTSKRRVCGRNQHLHVGTEQPKVDTVSESVLSGTLSSTGRYVVLTVRYDSYPKRPEMPGTQVSRPIGHVSANGFCFGNCAQRPVPRRKSTKREESLE